jgi:hypothetical protein
MTEWPEIVNVSVPVQGFDGPPTKLPVELSRVDSGQYEGSHPDIGWGETMRFTFQTPADLFSDDLLNFCTNVTNCPA